MTATPGAGPARIGGLRTTACRPIGRSLPSVLDYRPSGVRRALALLFSLLLFAVVLHLTYEYKIAPVFSYLGYRYRTPDVLNYSSAFLMTTIVTFLLPRRLKLPSDVVLWILLLMAYVPSTLLPQYADIISEQDALRLAVVTSCSFAAVVLTAHRGPLQRDIRQLVPPRVVFVSLGLVSLVVYVYMFYTTGLSFRYLSLTDIRDVRFGYRDTLAASGATLPYLVGAQGNIINPILIVRGIFARKWLVLVAGALGQLMIYSVTGYKLIALSVPAVALLCAMFVLFKKHLGITLMYGVLASSLVALLADLIEGGRAFTSIFINRLLLIPGILTAAHVMVFRDRPKAEWGYTFLAPFVDYPYSMTPAFMVGAAFSGSDETSANSNLFGDGYANLGYAGIFIEAFFLVLILWLVNYAGSRLPIAVSASILLVPTLALVNTSVFRAVLTSGFGAAALLMLVLPREGWGSTTSPYNGRPGRRTRVGASTSLRLVAGKGRHEGSNSHVTTASGPIPRAPARHRALPTSRPDASTRARPASMPSAPTAR